MLNCTDLSTLDLNTEPHEECDPLFGDLNLALDAQPTADYPAVAEGDLQ